MPPWPLDPLGHVIAVSTFDPMNLSLQSPNLNRASVTVLTLTEGWALVAIRESDSTNIW